MPAFSTSAFTFVAFVTLAKLSAGAFVAPRADAPFRIYLGTNADTMERFAMSGDSTSPDCDTGLVSISGSNSTGGGDLVDDEGYCGAEPFALDGVANLTVTGCDDPDNGTFIAENDEQTHRCGEYDGPANNCGVDWEYTCSEGVNN